MLAKKLGLVVLPEASTSTRNSTIDPTSPTTPTTIPDSEGYLAITADEYHKLLSQQKDEKVKSIARDLENDKSSSDSAGVHPHPQIQLQRSSSPDFHDALEAPTDASQNDTENANLQPTVIPLSELHKGENNEETLRSTAKSLGLVILTSAEMQSIQNNASETLKALELNKLESKSLEETRLNVTKELEEREAQNAKIVANSQAEAVKAIQLAKAAAEEAQAEASRIIKETKLLVHLQLSSRKIRLIIYRINLLVWKRSLNENPLTKTC